MSGAQLPATPFAFGGVVLTGGQSRRMGRDKAGLVLDGETLLERQVALLRSLEPAELWISARATGEYRGLGLPVLADAFPGQGPVAGIERALAAAAAPLVLVLAVDLPHMSADVLRRLLAACRAEGDTVVGAVPQFEGTLEPLAAVYPRTAQPLAAQRLDAGQNSARGFVLDCLERGLVRPLELTPADAPAFANWNRPEDVAVTPPPPARTNDD